jgi:hypothetical protein
MCWNIRTKCLLLYKFRIIKKNNNFKEFANTFNIPYDKLSETIIKYNKKENGKEDEFGKIFFFKLINYFK